MTATELTIRLIDHARTELAERIERMPDVEFLDQHAAIHAEPRSATIDIVAAVFEREYWRRWPTGRHDDEVQECPAA